MYPARPRAITTRTILTRFGLIPSPPMTSPRRTPPAICELYVETEPEEKKQKKKREKRGGEEQGTDGARIWQTGCRRRQAAVTAAAPNAACAVREWRRSINGVFFSRRVGGRRTVSIKHIPSHVTVGPTFESKRNRKIMDFIR